MKSEYKKKRKRAINMRKSGISIPKIAISLEVAKSTAREWVKDIELTDEQKRTLYRKTDYDENKALEMFASDMTYKEISEKLGIKKSTLISLYRRNGLSRSREGYSSCQICGKENSVRNKKFCSACNSAIRRMRNKIKSVEYLGGKCSDCNVELPVDNYAAYEFHHVDDKKDQLSTLMIKNWDKIEPELKKCELLCSNCHRIKHSNGNYEKLKKYL